MDKIYLLLTALLISVTPSAFAQDLNFDNLTKSSLEAIISDLSANFTHTTVSGASSLGKTFGFEVGVLGGITKTPEVETLVHTQDPSADVGQVPHVALEAQLSVPFGLTAELNLVPEVGTENFKASSMGLGVKWTLTESVLADLPLSLALKGHYKQTTLKFKQVIDADTFKSDLKFENKVSGAMLLVSKNLLIVEPYAGIGVVNGEGDLSFSGSPNNIFDPSLTTSSSASAKKSGSHLVLGAELKLLIFKVGLEYAKLFGTDRYTGKLAFYF